MTWQKFNYCWEVLNKIMLLMFITFNSKPSNVNFFIFRCHAIFHINFDLISD